MNLWRTLRDAAEAHPHDDPHAIANELMAKLRKADLVDLLADGIASMQRSRVRKIETAAFNPETAERVAEAMDRPDPLATLRGETFRLGNGREVSWDKATVEEHRQRVEMLERIRAGIAATIDRHQEAIRRIEDAGVTCLAELGESEAA